MNAAAACPFCHGRSVIGVELEDLYDGIIYWHCRSCEKNWHRFNRGDPRRAALETTQLGLFLSEPLKTN